MSTPFLADVHKHTHTYIDMTQRLPPHPSFNYTNIYCKYLLKRLLRSVWCVLRREREWGIKKKKSLLIIFNGRENENGHKKQKLFPLHRPSPFHMVITKFEKIRRDGELLRKAVEHFCETMRSFFNRAHWHTLIQIDNVKSRQCIALRALSLERLDCWLPSHDK